MKLTEIVPPLPGTYILLLRLPIERTLEIGRMGVFTCAPGWYAYVGSALGSGGLRGRLRHHLAPVRRPHWHIDYFRAAAPVWEVGYIASATPYEHEWAAALGAFPGATLPVARFGASDCRCPAHLFHFGERPEIAALHAEMRRLTLDDRPTLADGDSAEIGIRIDDVRRAEK